MSKISIILPTYNVEKYIARALDSCINQTLKDIEIIVVDDKGQDKSIDIAKEYALKDERIKIIHNKENLKLLHARAEGVKVANSELIMFLDTDDELELNACEIAYNNFDKDYDVLRFEHGQIGFEKELKLKKPKNYEDFIQKTKELKYFDFLMWDMLIKKDLYLQCLEYVYEYGLKDINFAEDVAFNFIINNIIKGYKKIDNKLYKYYKNETSMTNDKTNLLSNMQTFIKIFSFFDYLAGKYQDKFYNDLYITHVLFLHDIYFEIKREFIRSEYKNKGHIFTYRIKKLLLKIEKNKFKKRKKALLKEKYAKDFNNTSNL